MKTTAHSEQNADIAACASTCPGDSHAMAPIAELAEQVQASSSSRSSARAAPRSSRRSNGSS